MQNAVRISWRNTFGYISSAFLLEEFRRLPKCHSNITRSTFNRIRAEFLRFEEILVSCDPNPTEYVDTSNTNPTPSVVFYWGLNLGQLKDFNIYTLERDFRNNMSNGY